MTFCIGDLGIADLASWPSETANTSPPQGSVSGLLTQQLHQVKREAGVSLFLQGEGSHNGWQALPSGEESSFGKKETHCASLVPAW